MAPTDESVSLSDERDESRIHSVFEDISYHVEKLDYQVQTDFPGLTPEQKKYLRSLRRQLARIYAKVRQVGKL